MLLSREFPLSILAHLALGSALTAWLTTIGLVRSPIPMTAGEISFAIVGFDLAMLGFAESRWVRAILDQIRRAIPRFAIGTVFLAETVQLNFRGHWTGKPCPRAGAVAMFWTARLIRHRWLIDVGLVCIAGAVGDLVWWLAPHGNGGMLAGWEGIAAGLTALAFWGSAKGRPGPRSRFAPCDAVPALGVCHDRNRLRIGDRGRILAQDAFVLSVAGLLLDCVVILLIGRVWQSSARPITASPRSWPRAMCRS